MSNCVVAKPYTALRNLRDRVQALEANSGGSGGSGGSSVMTEHPVTTTSFINAAGISCQSYGGVVKVGGYFQTKSQHPGDGYSKSVICTISGVSVVGFAYGVVIDHESSSPKPYNILLYTENGQTKVQFESCGYALASGKWINFTVFGIKG